MKIGIDIDGVIADFVGSFLPRLQKYCKCKVKNIVNFNFWENLNIDKIEFDKIWEKEVIETNFYSDLKLVKGSLEALKILKKDNKLILISSREKQLARDTFNWLKHYGIPFSRLELVEKDKKKKVAKMVKCDLVIEDNLDIARMVEARGVPVLLFDYPWNKIGRDVRWVKNWKEAVKEIGLYRKNHLL